MKLNTEFSKDGGQGRSLLAQKKIITLSFLQRIKEHKVPFEIHMYRQLESALCYGRKNVFSGTITWSRQQMPFFVSDFSPYFSFFFFFGFDYFLLHFSSLLLHSFF